MSEYIGIFIGIDIRSKDGDVWSQQNIFTVDEEDKVVSVDANFTHSSNETAVCTSLPK